MIARLVFQTLLSLAGMGGLLFGAAGTLAWAAGWVYLIELGALGLWMGFWLARHDPALLAERLAPILQSQQSRWDKVFMLSAVAAWCGWLMLMGFDAMRLRWSSMPGWLAGAGALCMFLCVYLCRFVFRANSFAAPVVKIQRERGHKVVDTGPYACVRHPMYSAALLFFVGTPLLLGSWWGLVCVPVLAAGLGRRAVYEERVLTGQLDGYAQYASRVRYRFIPFVW